MKKWISIFTAIIFLAAVISNVFADSIPEKVLERSKGVFFIEAQSESATASGTAFAVYFDGSNTYLITNYHVVEENTNNVTVWISQNQSTQAIVAASDQQEDLALLKVSQKLDVPILKLNTNAQKGDDVYAVGFPAAADALSDSTSKSNEEATITNGIISSIRSLKITDFSNEVPILQINADINAGNSGGPLLNSNGEVVGVNAYSVTNSTGINGAIAASVVIDFIDEYGPFKLSASSTTGSPLPVWEILLLIFVGFCLILGFILFLTEKPKRKTEKKPMTEVYKEIPLGEYLHKINRSLNAGEIASLMLPLAIELRGRHNQGSLFLRLSPRALLVSKQGVRINPDPVEPAQGQLIFMAPEQRANLPVSAATDVYSFCAVLTYLANYRPEKVFSPSIPRPDTDEKMNEGAVPPPIPSKNLTPAQNSVTDEQNNWLQGIIDKGMQFNPEKRFLSFQELIFALSGLNSGMSETLTSPLKAERPQQKQGKKKGSVLLACGIALVLFLVGIVLYQFYVYFSLNKAVAADDFESGQKYLAQLIEPGLLAPEQQKYVQAGSLLLNHKYDDAFSAFIEIQGSYDAVNMALETKYEKAAWLADSGSFDDAIAIYLTLGQYKDSSELVKSTEYRKGNYLISENEFAEALSVFEDLQGQEYSNSKEMVTATNYAWGLYNIQNQDYYDAYKKLMLAKDYKDADAQMNNLKAVLYKEAVDCYHSANYTKALDEFTMVDDYLDAKSYAVLARAHSGTDILTADEITNDLAPLIGFEDAGDIIVSDFYYATTYLSGMWSGGGHSFAITKNGSFSDIASPTGDHYTIENGTYYVYNENDAKTLTPAYIFKPVSKDLLLLYAYSDAQTYSLLRVATAADMEKFQQ